MLAVVVLGLCGMGIGPSSAVGSGFYESTLTQPKAGGHTGAGYRLSTSKQRRVRRIRIADGARFAVRPATIYGWTSSAREILGGRSSDLPEGYGPGSFGRIKWKTWRAHVARGKGIVWSNDCDPSCGNGTWHGKATTLKIYRVRNGLFTRMKFTSKGRPGNHLHAIFGYRGELPPQWEFIRRWHS